MEGVQAAMTTRNLEPDQWKNREEWRLVSGRRRQLLKNRIDRFCICMFPQEAAIISPYSIKQMVFLW
jgi:hypothetical protein